MKTIEYDVLKTVLLQVLGYGEDAINEDGDSSNESVAEYHKKIHDRFNKGRQNGDGCPYNKSMTECHA